MIVGVVGTGVVTDPLIPLVDVRRVGMAGLVNEVALLRLLLDLLRGCC